MSQSLHVETAILDVVFLLRTLSKQGHLNRVSATNYRNRLRNLIASGSLYSEVSKLLEELQGI